MFDRSWEDLRVFRIYELRFSNWAWPPGPAFPGAPAPGETWSSDHILKTLAEGACCSNLLLNSENTHNLVSPGDLRCSVLVHGPGRPARTNRLPAPRVGDVEQVFGIPAKRSPSVRIPACSWMSPEFPDEPLPRMLLRPMRRTPDSGCGRNSGRRTAAVCRPPFCRPSRDLFYAWSTCPAMNRWAILCRPADLG